MKKSWVSRFLPEDEYKEKMMLYFIAEASLILMLLLIIYGIFDHYLFNGDLLGVLVAMFSIGVFSIYVLIRYTFSGVEHPEVTSEKEFSKKKKMIRKGSLVFMFVFLTFLLLQKGIPSNLLEIVDLIGPTIIAGVFWFVVSYFSLKASFKKNRELLDE
ncbi:DUF3278 domain-containing protein [Bacillus carboniphilus]|uniref:DUF3278 domain-containing protein n=1 Tax=Bacillus carboniphilus TaxID=86663 RepID=A0ABY9JVB9_9BACI|nr:DUF6773 family protein [Bacillus carboniphilus]WLR42228.1 DUF3278 domain-containing protein [Bacillus carboniphilus]